MGFTFKQFHIDDDRCGMKVGTDSVLLGSWARIAEQGNTLDLGCGSGLLALCCAQRGAARVDALEIDAEAAQQARENSLASPWQERIQVHQGDLRRWAEQRGGHYRHLISNPPYFGDSLAAPCPKRATARSGLSLDTLVSAIERLLSPQGHASLVLPAQSQAQLRHSAGQVGLNLSRLTLVKTVAARADKLILVELARDRAGCQTQQLVIHGPDGSYSDEFRALTADFYLKG